MLDGFRKLSEGARKMPYDARNVSYGVRKVSDVSISCHMVLGKCYIVSVGARKV